MTRAQGLTADRQRHVNRLGGEGALLLLSLDLLLLGAKRAPETARSLPMSLPASFFWSAGSEPIALLACVIADSAPAYWVLMAFNSSELEAFSIFPMPSLTAAVTACDEYRALCHEYPFYFSETSLSLKPLYRLHIFPI